MRRKFWLLFTVALFVFLASSLGVLLSLQEESALLARLSLGGMAVASVLFLMAAILPSRHVDWKRIEAEQRLWESGRLGRTWLRIRQRISNVWKI